MTPPQPISPDLLLEHAAFLRGLARSLVVDEARAEDVVQETYLAALSKPPPPHVRLRAWLAGVTRNLALRSRRTERRIKRREEARRGPVAVAATEDVASRLDAQRHIADAVAELSEPGRRAIVHRYFDGLKPAEIARREGVPVRTIESRLRRAREALRERMDKHYGGSRGAWVFILAPTLGLTLEAIGASTASAATTAAATSSAAAGSTAALGSSAASTKAASTAMAASSATVAQTAGAGATLTGVTLMSTKLVVGIAAACVAGAFFAGWQMNAPSDDGALKSDERGSKTMKSVPRLTNDKALLDKARRELVAEKERSEQLEAELTRLRPKPGASAPAEATATGDVATPGKAEGARYKFHAVKDALDKANWKEVGEAVNKMVPLLVDLKDSIEAGKGLPSNVGDLQRWNAPLLTLALSTQEQIPGTGINGSFTHPSIMSNLVYSALAQSQVPLDEKQQQQLAEIGNRYVAEDERRIQGYGDDVLALQKTADEADLKGRFFKDVDAILTPEQQEVLHPSALKGRIGIDLFSSGLVWQLLVKPAYFSKREELPAKMAQVMLSDSALAEHKELVEAAAADWARSFSDAYLQATNDPTAVASSEQLSGGMMIGWLPTELADKAAVHQIAMLKNLLDRLPPDSGAAKQLRASSTLMMPVMKPATGGDN